MSVSRTSMQQISQAFFNLYHDNEDEIDSLYNTIESCLDGISQSPGEFKNCMPTADHFKDDSTIKDIDDLYCDAHFSADLIAKVLYIKWYYQMTLLAMGSVTSKKVVEYIHTNTNHRVKVALEGSDFRYILGNPIKFSIRNDGGGGAFNAKYSGLRLYSPIWDDILEYFDYNEGEVEDLIRLKMPISLEIASELGNDTYWNDSVPVADLGKYIKKYFIYKIKEVVNNQVNP